jgi:recombination protein RecA
MAEKRPELQKYFDSEQIVFGNDPSLERERLPTGIAELDIFLDGGLYRKGFSIFAGNEGQGKTWTAQQLAKTSLIAGLQVCYIDLEKAYDPKWWTQVGVPIEKMWVASPHSGEDCIDLTVGLLKEGVDIVIIDSLAAMLPLAEEEATAESSFYALQARLNSSFFRVANQSNRVSHVFIIQQLREKVGIVYGNPATIPGGNALKFYSSTTIQCKRKEWIEENKVRKGFVLRYECMKQRGSANPGDYTEVSVLFNGKMDEIGQMIGIAIGAGVIEQRGAFYYIIDKSTGENLATIQGKGKLSEVLEKDTELYQKVLDLLP